MSKVQHNKQVYDLQKVLEISRAMVAAEDLDGLLALIINRGVELLQSERATIFLYDSARDELVSRIATGTNEIRVPAANGLAGAALKSGKVVNVPDAYADARFNPAVDRQTHFRTRNILSVPLRGYEGSLVGVLQVLNKRGGPFGDYDVTLAETLAAQAGVAIQRAHLIEHYLVKQQMERAMSLARDIQQGLLPKGPPAIDGFDVAGFWQPADQTGGDTYDFMPLPDGRWLFIVADATGHGIGPALVIAETRAMLRAIFLQASHTPRRPDAEVSSVLQTANDFLAADLDAGRFVTCFLGVLDASDSSLTYASAGHGPLIFYDRKKGSFQALGATAIPLGVVAGTEYSRTVRHLFADGDFAAIVTDGFLEATDRAGSEFGLQRTMAPLGAARDMPATEMALKLHQALAAFTAGCRQADDLTAVIIKKT